MAVGDARGKVGRTELDVAALARRMKAAQDAAVMLPSADTEAHLDVEAAYAVADAVHDLRLAEGAVGVGRKIGFTNRNIWAQYGVYQPIWGRVYRHGLVHARDGRAEVALSSFVQPKIEPEIVLHLARTPPATDDPAALLACVDWIAHGFEIVQSPYPGWRFGVGEAIAAAALHGCLVLGAPVLVADLASDPISALASFTVILHCDGQAFESGRGANVLGSPLAALAHLVAATDGDPKSGLQAGELVSTGTLTAAFDVSPGECWHTSLQGIALPGLALSLTA